MKTLVLSFFKVVIWESQIIQWLSDILANRKKIQRKPQVYICVILPLPPSKKNYFKVFQIVQLVLHVNAATCKTFG